MKHRAGIHVGRVLQQVDAERAGAFRARAGHRPGCGRRVIWIGRIDHDPVDHDLQGLDPGYPQVKRGETEFGVRGLAVRQSVVCDECQIILDVQLDRDAQPFGAGEDEPQPVEARAAVVNIDRGCILCRDINQRVVAGISADRIAARAAVKQIVARATIELVGAGSPKQRIGARAAIELVVTGPADDRIVAARSHVVPRQKCDEGAEIPSRRKCSAPGSDVGCRNKSRSRGVRPDHRPPSCLKLSTLILSRMPACPSTPAPSLV